MGGITNTIRPIMGELCFFAFRYEKENVVFSTLEVVNEN